MLSRIRYLFSTPREIRSILLISAAVFSVILGGYYVHYLAGVHGLMDGNGKPFGRDFIAYWTAILLLGKSNISGIYSPAVFADTMHSLLGGDIGMFWGYPPHYLFLLWPFTAISQYKMAYAAWSAINVIAFALAIFWRSSLTWGWIALCAPSVIISVFIGQNGLLSAALLIGGFRLLRAFPWLAGVLFGLLTFKPQLGILIPFILLALRQYKAFAGAAITFAALVIASGLVFGWQSWEGFFYGIHNFPQGAFNKMISVAAAMQTFGLSLPFALLVQLCVSVIIMLALCYRLTRIRQAYWAEWLLLIMPAVYLVTPYAFPYDLCALNGAWLLWLMGQGEKKIFPLSTLVWLTLWYIPFFNEALIVRGLPLTPFLLMVAFITSWKKTGPHNIMSV